MRIDKIMQTFTFSFHASFPARALGQINRQLKNYFDNPQRVTSRDSGILVKTATNRIAAFLVFEDYRDESLYDGHPNVYIGQKYIAWVYTLPKFRGLGLFAKMMRFAQHKYSLIVLHEDSTNARLLDTYEKLGFQIVPKYSRQVNQTQEDGSLGYLEQNFMVWRK